MTRLPPPAAMTTAIHSNRIRHPNSPFRYLTTRTAIQPESIAIRLPESTFVAVPLPHRRQVVVSRRQPIDNPHQRRRQPSKPSSPAAGSTVNRHHRPPWGQTGEIVGGLAYNIQSPAHAECWKNGGEAAGGSFTLVYGLDKELVRVSCGSQLRSNLSLEGV